MPTKTKPTDPKDTGDNRRIEREAHLRWVRLGDLYPSPVAQRHKLNHARVDHICADLDLEQVGLPTLNSRDGHTFIIDGWHRVEALRQFGFEEDDKIQAWVYEGLSETDEAERFLKLNDTLAVDAFSKFRVSVNAGRVVETDIDRIVRSQGLHVSRDNIEGGVRAVGTLIRVYNRSGPSVLSRTLRLVRDAYGTAGMEASVIDGIGLLCGRYDGELNDETAVNAWSKMHGGVKGLLNRAEVLRRQTGNPKGQCVAAAAVDVINGRRGSKKLRSWWREDG